MLPMLINRMIFSPSQNDMKLGGLSLVQVRRLSFERLICHEQAENFGIDFFTICYIDHS
jgi:hypothetical protein